jgi:hypothetical protein
MLHISSFHLCEVLKLQCLQACFNPGRTRRTTDCMTVQPLVGDILALLSSPCISIVPQTTNSAWHRTIDLDSVGSLEPLSVGKARISGNEIAVATAVCRQRRELVVRVACYLSELVGVTE